MNLIIFNDIFVSLLNSLTPPPPHKRPACVLWPTHPTHCTDVEHFGISPCQVGERAESESMGP